MKAESKDVRGHGLTDTVLLFTGDQPCCDAWTAPASIGPNIITTITKMAAHSKPLKSRYIVNLPCAKARIPYRTILSYGRGNASMVCLKIPSGIARFLHSAPDKSRIERDVKSPLGVVASMPALLSAT
jgi:hypothetical protein